MRARLLLVLAAGGGAAGVGGGLVTTGAQPAPAPSCTVTVAAVSPAVVHRGDAVTVGGSGFTCGGAAGAPPVVTVGGHPVALADGATDSSLVVEAGDAEGGVQVTAHDQGCHSCPAPAPSNDDHLLLAAPAATAATLTAPEGGHLSVTGTDLDLGGHLAGVDAIACGQELTANAHAATEVTLTAPGQFCQGPLTLRLSVYTDTEHDATTRWSLPAGRIDTAMVAGALSVTHAAPGEAVRICGSGFGPGGAARLGGRPVPSTWFDRAVEITPEPDSVSGEVELVRFDGRRIDAGRLAVDATVTNRPGPRPAPVSEAPRIPPTPPPAPSAPPSPSPRPDLALRPAQTSGLPGHDVPFTITLTAGGAPLAGAAVDLAFARAPAGDASVTPSLGLTDSDGRILGLLHLSRRPGDHVIVARAGRSSAQVTVAACCRPPVPPAAGRLTADDTDRNAQRGPLVAAMCVACLVLFLSGFALNLATTPRKP
jgi:hypothetical protein